MRSSESFDVPPLDRESRKSKPESVSSVLVHHEKGVDHISPGFAHLLPFGIPNEGMYIDLVEWDFLHEIGVPSSSSGRPRKTGYRMP